LQIAQFLIATLESKLAISLKCFKISSYNFDTRYTQSRPGLTDCGALGKIILEGPQIKVKTKKKKKKATATSCSHSTPINVITYPNTAAK